MSEWISVKDNPPDKSNSMVLISNFEMVTAGHFTEKYPDWDRDGNVTHLGPGWVISEEEGIYFSIDEFPFWMPLPLPPENNES